MTGDSGQDCLLNKMKQSKGYGNVFLPSDLGRIDDCWWLLVKVVDASPQDLPGEGVSMVRIRNTLLDALNRIYDRGNKHFCFVLGYEKTIPEVLENMADLGFLKRTPQGYILSKMGKEILPKMEESIRRYCGVENLNKVIAA